MKIQGIPYRVSPEGHIDHWLVAGPDNVALPAGMALDNFNRADLHLPEPDYLEHFRRPVEWEVPLVVGEESFRWQYLKCLPDHRLDFSAEETRPQFSRRWLYTEIRLERRETGWIEIQATGNVFLWYGRTRLQPETSYRAEGMATLRFKRPARQGRISLFLCQEENRFDLCPSHIAVKWIAARAGQAQITLPTVVSAKRRQDLQEIIEAAYLDRRVYSHQDPLTIRWPESMHKVAMLGIEFGWMPSASNWPLYKSNEEQGQYIAIPCQNLTGAAMLFQPNQTFEGDTVQRDIFRDKRFRIALSHAINRDEINEVAFFGRATPQQATVIPACSFYEEKYAKLNIEYDVDKANSLLDEMGLEWDADGEWRVRPDGETLAWTIESGIDPQTNTVWQLVKGYWAAIGCDVQVKTVTGELISERYPGNQVAMGTWGADKCTDWLFPLTPQFWVPYNLGWESTMYPLWTRWIVTDGETGEEPPDELKQLWALWQEMKITTDMARQVELGKEIVRINAENMYIIGTVALPPHPVVIKDNLGNMPTIEQGLLFGWDLYQFYPYHSEQLYLKTPRHARQEYAG